MGHELNYIQTLAYPHLLDVAEAADVGCSVAFINTKLPYFRPCSSQYINIHYTIASIEKQGMHTF